MSLVSLSCIQFVDNSVFCFRSVEISCEVIPAVYLVGLFFVTIADEYFVEVISFVVSSDVYISVRDAVCGCFLLEYVFV